MRWNQRGGEAGRTPVETSGLPVIPRQRGASDAAADQHLLLLHLLPVSGQQEPCLQDDLPTLAGEWQVGPSTLLLTTSGVVHVLRGRSAETWQLRCQGLTVNEVVQAVSSRYGIDPQLAADHVLPLLAGLPQVAGSRSDRETARLTAS